MSKHYTPGSDVPDCAAPPSWPRLATPDEAIAAIGRGEMVIVVDSPNRENEGDLVLAAEWVTPAAINFMATHARGLICVAMTDERLQALGIPAMTPVNTDPHGTAFHVSVDHVGNSTGISARDRAQTVRTLADPQSVASDFRQPGHTFPLRARPGGVLARAGHTEASLDLVTEAGLQGAAVICEIAAADGEMARLPALLRFAQEHDLLVCCISDLIAHRRRTQQVVQRESEARVPLAAGAFTAYGYVDTLNDQEHIAFVHGDISGPDVLVRVHSECLTGDVFGSQRCECGEQLQLALARVVEEGAGVVVYLRGHEGRGIGLIEKLHAYRLQDRGLDTVEANVALGHPVDARDYSAGAQILRDLGISSLRLLTNNPDKCAGLQAYGLSVDQVPLVTRPNGDNVRYLETKRARLGHLLDAMAGG